jgi:hypothetical protein
MVQLPAVARGILLLQSVQSGFGGNPASYSRGTTGLILWGVKVTLEVEGGGGSKIDHGY